MVTFFALLISVSGWASSDSKLFDRLGLERIQGEVPQFEFQNSKSVVLGAADYKSKILILHFWATWCESCKRELPQLGRLQENIKGAEFIPLSADDSNAPSRVQNFLDGSHLNMPAYILTAKPDNKKFIAWGIPMTYFISANQHLFLRARGARDWSRVSAEDLQKLTRLLK